MYLSAFKTIEDRLRFFLHDVCVCLTENSTDCLYEFFDGKYHSFDQLELNDYLYLLRRNARVEKRARTSYLFDRHMVTRSTVDDLNFAATLRNKYAHQNGIHVPHSDEQLADMLIVQRLVRDLSKLCNFQDTARELFNTLEKLVKELVVQVAQVQLPEKFDTEGESNVLSKIDRDFFKDLVYEAVRDARPVEIASNDLNGNHQEKGTAGNDIPLLDIQAQLKKLDRKLSPISSLKGRIDTLESSISDQLAVMQSTVSEIQNGIYERLDDPDEDFVETEDQNEYAFDDEGEEDEGEQERLAKLSRTLGTMIAKKLKEAMEVITPAQARDELISLRKRIWRETESGPSGDGLLRKSMIDNFLYYLPPTPEHARTGNMSYWLTTVSQDQLEYLDDVCSILRRVRK